MRDLRGVVGSLEDTFRVSLRVIPGLSGDYAFDIRFEEFPSPFGMSVRIQQNPLTWQARTIMDSQSGEVVQALRLRWIREPQEVQGLLDNGLQTCGYLELRVNDVELSKMDADSPWVMAELVGKSKKSEDEPILSLHRFLSSFLGTTLDVFAEWHSTFEAGEVEGDHSRTTYNRYERSSANRAVCLSVYGSVCVACGEDPGVKYKMDGRRIIHVHHLTPVSQMGGPRLVDPITELVPLCPNCHNVAHKKNPPYTPKEIIGLLNEEA